MIQRVLASKGLVAYVLASLQTKRPFLKQTKRPSVKRTGAPAPLRLTETWLNLIDYG